MPEKCDHLWDAVSRKALVNALREIFNRHCKPLTPGSVKTREVTQPKPKRRPWARNVIETQEHKGDFKKC